MRGWSTFGLLLLALRGPWAAEPDDQALAALFPKPPATVVARLAADLDGDRLAELAVLYDTRLEGRYRLAVVRVSRLGEPRLLAASLKAVEVTGTPTLTANALGGARPAVVLAGAAAAGGAWQAFALQADRLVTLATLTGPVVPDPSLADLDGDGQMELLHVGGEPLGGPCGEGLTDYRIEPWQWRGARYERVLWREADPSPGPAPSLSKLAAGHLWRQAVAVAAAAHRAAPSPATAWNLGLAERLARLFEQQAVTRAESVSAAGQVAAAAAAVLAGDHQAAAERLLGLGRAEELPPGWEEPFARLRPIVEAAIEASPDLLQAPATQVLRGFGSLALGQLGPARIAFLRARSGWPDPAQLGPWVVVGARGACLYYLDREGRLRLVEIGPDGRPRWPIQVLDALGPLRSVAALATAPAFAFVPEAGDQVGYQDPDGHIRILLAGEYLNLVPHAFSPDGRYLAVDSGTAAVRRLVLVEVATGMRVATLTHAGGFAWSPTSTELVIEVSRLSEPPLPWEDGGTRDLVVVGLGGQETGRLAAGDANTVWSVLSWDQPGRVLATLTRFKRTPGSLDARVTAVDRLAIDRHSGRATPLTGPAPGDLDRALVTARLKLAPESFELVEAAANPGFVLFRRPAARGSELYLLPRDGDTKPFRLGSAPPLTQPLVAAWGALADRSPEADHG